MEVYGPVPVSYSARQRELGVCGICRASMRLADDDDMPRSSSKMGGGNSRSLILSQAYTVSLINTSNPMCHRIRCYDGFRDGSNRR